MIDRRDRGKHITRSEATTKQSARAEKELQQQVIGLLRRNGIEPIVNRFGKRTTTNKGCPDILFAAAGIRLRSVHRIPTGTVCACAWEFKIPPNEMSREQVLMSIKLTSLPSAWIHRVIISYDQAVDELKSMGVIPS